MKGKLEHAKGLLSDSHNRAQSRTEEVRGVKNNPLETPCLLVCGCFTARQLQVQALPKSSPLETNSYSVPLAVLGQGNYQILHIHAMLRLLSISSSKPCSPDMQTFLQTLPPQYNRQSPKSPYLFHATLFLLGNVSPALFLNLPNPVYANTSFPFPRVPFTKYLQLYIPSITLLSLLSVCLNLKDVLSKNMTSAYVNCSVSCTANVMYFHPVKHVI